eukprot:136309-Rhodomonas_salina.1
MATLVAQCPRSVQNEGVARQTLGQSKRCMRSCPKTKRLPQNETRVQGDCGSEPDADDVSPDHVARLDELGGRSSKEHRRHRTERRHQRKQMPVLVFHISVKGLQVSVCAQTLACGGERRAAGRDLCVG